MQKIKQMKQMKQLAKVLYPAFIILVCGIASCSENEDNNDKSKLPDAQPIVLELAEKVETDNSFALDLFKTTYYSTDKENVFISPLSVNMALGMTLNGAKSTTLDEMKEALRASSYSLDKINTYNKSLAAALKEVDPSTALSIANSIWCRHALTLNSDFVSVNQEAYNAEIKAVDFTSSATVNQINNWVADQTNNKIPQIVRDLPEETQLFLVNAIYFNGKWKSKFNKSNTREENFYSEEGVSMGKVNMMRQNTRYTYTDDENCGYLKMPYGNGAFNMILMLPHEGKTVENVISNLDNETWNKAMNMESYEVNLSLPRFKMECAYEMHKTILPEMGMVVPFTNDADFSGISGDQFLKISRVIHKTCIDVNEEGTEAAASTGVSVGDMMSPPPGTIIDYVVNKPFAFAIRENSTGIILFMGKMGKVQ